jgi:diguanylate cyclase (GGDEF)-like protein/PAS domain S-box-containing protein
MDNPETESGKPVVLVVDDDRFQRQFVCGALVESGFAIGEAESGRQALEILKQSEPDILLLDVVMPDMDGFSVCAELRKLPQGRHLPVVMVTALEDADSIARAFDAGATDFITKPINPLILAHRLHYILRAGHAFQELFRNRTRLSQAQRLARLGNWEWDIRHNRFSLSEEAIALIGLAGRETPETYEAFLALVHPSDRKLVADAVAGALQCGENFHLDHRILTPGGSERFIHGHAEVTFDAAGKPSFMFGTYQDITGRKQAEEQIRALAYYDSLTGLPNRALFNERLSYILAHARRYDHPVALLFLDLDSFKSINDSLGHSTGDLLLQEVAKRLSTTLRHTDLVTRQAKEETAQSIARLGGDEFTIWVTDLENVQDVIKIAHRVLDSFASPFALKGREISVTASIGISLYPEDGLDGETLLKNADSAMYHAKSLGKNNYQFYSASLNAAARKMLALEARLARALDRKEFFLAYQPQVDFVSGRIFGVEALLRWGYEEDEVLAPGDFIPLAEETGLILPIGEWVLAQACSQVMAWQKMGLPPIAVSVNLSSRQFWQERLVDTVSRILAETSLPSKNLHLEITENLLMKDFEATDRILKRLKSMGVRLCLDDFGTGYSSLNHLKRFPLDILKIDRSFVRDIESGSRDMAIVAAIIAMAHSLNLEVIAEGVESTAQYDFLSSQGCRGAQGFLLARPMAGEEFVDFFRNWKSDGEKRGGKVKGPIPGPTAPGTRRHP